MADERLYDSKTWVEETGASTGDARENDPHSAGFAGGEDRVFRSRLQRVNRLADRAPGPDEAETIEKDHESGWLNVRVGSGEWAAVPVVRDADIADSAQQGRVSNMPPAGTSPSHDRVTFSDPVAGGVDPTSPWSPDSEP